MKTPLKIKLIILAEDFIRFFTYKIPMNLAFMLPHKIKLWCFIYVYGSDGKGPTDEYKEKYDFYALKYKVKL